MMEKITIGTSGRFVSSFLVAFAVLGNVMSVAKTVSPKKALDLYQAGKVVIVDVREGSEYDSKNIPIAVLVSQNGFVENFEQLKNGAFSGKEIIIHCRSGVRSDDVVDKIKSKYNVEIKSIEKGLLGWEEAGLPVKLSNKMPISRQVQSVVGISLLVSGLFTLLYSRKFSIVTLIVGSGLTVAGLTGWCGLAKALMFAPWN
ncbi:MAG: DUF2892 domain-containing protein [Alphaproteobacteria bacterium]|nr:DUF2892 domain-containing protein [Rickettsiales bacterium]